MLPVHHSINRLTGSLWVLAMLAVLLTLNTSGSLAQTFVPVSTGLPNLSFGSTRWGDYDSDGDLDLLMTGRAPGGAIVSSVFENDAGTFTDIGAGLTGVYSGAADWGDYDNDNDLDIIVSGWDNASNRRMIIYRNDGSGTFVDINAGLIGLAQGAVDWGDYDNDGDLDILIMGIADFPTLETTRIYRNDGGDVFVESPAVLLGLFRGSVDWGDYDADGDLDILTTGQEDFSFAHSLLYRNDGIDNFTSIDPGFIDLYDGEARWGDYDSDGDLDILINGSENGATVFHSLVYRNDGGDTFTDINATLDDAGEGSALALGDCDNDGDLDVLMSGITVTGVDLYRYDSDSVFTRLNVVFGGRCCGSHAWGDYDADGDLDAMTAILDANDGLFRNDVSPPNTPPGPPTGLTATVDGSAVTLTWLPGTDNETASAGLTYNVRVGTTPGGSEVISAVANAATGFRKVVDFGNAGHNTSRGLPSLGEATYHWSVQTIDNGYAGSVFAAEQTFTVGPQVCDCAHHGDVGGGDGFIDLLDVIALVNVVFHGVAAPTTDPQCPHINRGDANCDSINNVLDIVMLIDYTFRGGVPPCDPCVL